MKRVLGGLGRSVWYLAAVVVVLCAALVSLGQYYFPYLDDYREEILERVNGGLPFGVELAGLNAEWTGLSPTFHLTGLRLHAAGDPAVTILSAPRGEVSIDLVRSLVAMSPRLRRISAENVRAALLEEPGGRWHIAGLGSPRAATNGEDVLGFFLAIQEISLQHARLEFYPAAGGYIVTQDADLFLENFRNFRRLRVGARETGSAARLDLLVEASGDPRLPGSFEAQAHATLKDAPLERLQPLFGARAIPQGEVSGELWGAFGPDRQLRLQGGLSAPRLVLPPLSSGREFKAIEQVDTRFALEWADGKGSLWLDRLHGSWDGQQVELDRIRLDSARVDGGWTHSLGVEYLELGALSSVVLSSAVLSDPWAGVLSDLAPYGGLADAHADLRLVGGARPEVAVRARLEDLSASPWKSAPGVRNLRGVLRADSNGGQVDIDAGAVTLEFPRLYREDLDFDRVRGRVYWSRDQQGLEVGAERLVLGEGETAFDALFRLHLFSDPQREDELSLAVGIQNGEVEMQHRFLPYVVSGELRQWLDGALRAGHVSTAMFALRSAFGRQDQTRPLSLQLLLDVDGGSVAYHPDWPRVDGARARLLMDDKLVWVWADAGEIYGSRIEEALVGVDLSRKPARLQVRGTLQGDLADGLRVIDTSPLADITKGVLREWRGDGALRVALGLDIPLGAPLAAPDARIDVEAGIQGARLDLGGYGLQIDALRGTIGYSLERGLSSQGLDGTLWGRPLRALIEPGDAGAGSFAVQVDGTAAVADLERWIGSSAAGMLEGVVPFRLRMAQERGSLVSRIDSNLAGVSSGLPAPLGKPADALLPLAISWWATPDGTAARAGLGDLAQAALEVDRNRVVRGEVVAGSGTPPQAGGDGLRLRGAVASADAGEWIVGVERLLKANARERQGEPIGFRMEGLRVGEARLWSGTVRDARIDSRWEQGDFVLDFAADAVTGAFRAPADRSGPLALKIERLDLQPFLPAADAPAAPAVPSGGWQMLEGVQLPEIDVGIAALRLGARDLGKWNFRLGSPGGVLSLSDVTGELPGAVIAGHAGAAGASMRLAWQDGVPYTEIDTQVVLGDVGVFSNNLGQTPILESRKGLADLALRWPGGPNDFAFATANGSMKFSFRDGRLLSESSNNPLMRAIGLLRFDELLRRIKFNFKDFYQQGLVFDRFDAPLEFAEGVVRTGDKIEIEGPGAKIRLEGRSDLRERKIDAAMTVTLPIGSNLPWVAALAGGLPVAAGVLVASQLFADQIGKLSSAVYKVSGSLEDPKVELQKVFDVEPPKQGAAPASKKSR